MTADPIVEALERGRAARNKKSKWEPVDVEFTGHLVARIEDTTNGNVEGIYYHVGQWLYYALGRAADGKVVVHRVPAGELRRIAKAMIGEENERGDLINAAAMWRRKKRETGKPTRRVKRKPRK
jgi:hypothetical protein